MDVVIELSLAKSKRYILHPAQSKYESVFHLFGKGGMCTGILPTVND